MSQKLIAAVAIALFSITLLIGVAKAEDYIITATANGKPITITVSITEDGVTAKSSDKSVQILGVTPPITVTKPPTLTNPEINYLTSIGEAVDLYTSSFAENERLMGALSANPKLMYSPAWMKEMQSALEDMLSAAEIVKNTIPPKRFASAHETLTEASKHLVGYVYRIATFLQDYDADAFDLAVQEVEIGVTLYQQAMGEYETLLNVITK